MRLTIPFYDCKILFYAFDFDWPNKTIYVSTFLIIYKTNF